jgi:hypothetical protein
MQNSVENFCSPNKFISNKETNVLFRCGLLDINKADQM